MIDTLKILIATDGSAQSQAAINLIITRRWPADAMIKLVTVVDDDEATLRAAHLKLEELARTIQPVVAPTGVSHEVLSGPVSDAIVETAQRWQADVIVTGSRGHSILENVVLGSVSQSLLERSQVPLLIGRDIAQEARGNILLPIDDSRFSAAAVEWLAAQEWANTCTISLISILNPRPAGLGHDLSVAKASENLLEYQHERFLAGYSLQQWAIRLQTHLPGATIHHGFFEGDARGLILKAAHNWPAALIVMGSHGRTGLSKLVLGSVSQYVAANARCCVAIVKGVTSIYYDEVQALIEKEDKLGDLLSRPIDSGRPGEKPHVMPFHMIG